MMRYLGVLALLSSASYAAANSCAVADSAKTDCGYAGIDESGCVNKGCCWAPAGTNSVTPWCFYGDTTVDGYSLTSITATSTGFSGTLQLLGEGSTTYGADIDTLSLEIVFETEDIAHVKISDAKAARWQVPESVVPRLHATKQPASLNYKFTYTESPFTFEVIRISDQRSLFKLDNSFIFKNQYLEFTTSKDSSAATFGLGESTRMNQALQSGKTYTMWAADIPALSMNKNLYGSYPYYLQMVGGAAHGAMLMSSNGMDVLLNDKSITFKVIGGIFDVYVFAGSTPASVVDQYTQVIGRPTMMPYWSLGFHNCKYGYTDVYQVEQVVKNYAAANIPLDTQWMDIDYMQNYRDFTLDSVNFPQPEVASFVNTLHQDGQHFVPIIDPGIMVYAGYEAYERGVSEGLFIKDLSGGYYLGQVWPGPTYFPDFLNPSSQSYWTDQLKAFYNMVNVDGIWIDMNEISNFCNSDGNGQVCVNSASSGCPAPGASQTDCCLVCSTVDNQNTLDFPPYNINNAYGKLSTKTVAVSGTQYGNVSVYDAHNIYGLTEQIATNQALRDIRGKRPFLLSRSSFLSTGVHSAKWTGDNGATWDDLKSSIVSIMDFNLFGVPMIGADICGFIYDTTEELCARWIEVGAFYPFSRNHNTLGAAPQELYLWDSVAEASRNALGMRYQLLPYLYTLFFNANQKGETVARAQWMNFPTDTTALTVDRQFMLGSGILVTPVLDQGATSVSGYFPQGLWYNFQQRSLDIDASNGGVWKTISTPLTSTNVHVKGGSIIPLQQSAMTTTAGRKTPFTLLVALCPGGQAYGSLFWDDGEQISLTNSLQVSYQAVFANGSGSVTSTVSTNTYSDASQLTVGTIQVLGKGLAVPSSITLNGQTFSGAEYDASKNSLTFSNVNIKLSSAIDLQWH